MDRIGAACSIWAAIETGLIRELTARPQRAADLAERLGLDALSTRYVLDILVGEGLADRRGDGYTSSPPLARIREGMPVLGRAAMELWRDFSGSLRGDAPRWAMDADTDTRARVYRETTPTLGRLFDGPAIELAAKLGPAGRVLDLGCGSGVWGLALARADPDTRVVGVDFEPVLDAMKERATEMGLLDRCELVAADLRTDELPSPFDTVILANVLRLETADVARSMAERAANCVAAGGRLVVIDAIAAGSAHADRAVALYALQLRLRTQRGAVHPRSELIRWLEALGLEDVTGLELETGPEHLGVLVARRPDRG